MTLVPTLREIAASAPAADLDAIRALLRDYQAAIGISLDFQDFEAELAALPGAYQPPRGALVLACLDGRPVGTVALRPLDWPQVGEVKRLYVDPGARGHGLGMRLAVQILAIARRLGYRRLRLDTLPTMTAALSLYGALGFRDIAPYCHNPIAGARFLECELPTTGAG